MEDEDDLGIDGLTKPTLIEHGASSSVHAATDVKTGQRVAVKVLRADAKYDDGQRFVAEQRILTQREDNRNAVSVLTAGITRHGRAYAVMDLIDGTCLAELRWQEGPPSWPRAVSYVIPVAEALARSHQLGVLHRDVRPENILLTGEIPKLIGFDYLFAAELPTPATANLTSRFCHQAPELLTRRHVPDQRADLYSLASTLYTLIAGFSPFDPDREILLWPLISALIEQPAPPLRSDLVPRALNDFVKRGLSKSPDRRPATAEVFIAELQDIAT